MSGEVYITIAYFALGIVLIWVATKALRWIRKLPQANTRRTHPGTSEDRSEYISARTSEVAEEDAGGLVGGGTILFGLFMLLLPIAVFILVYYEPFDKIAVQSQLRDVDGAIDAQEIIDNAKSNKLKTIEKYSVGELVVYGRFQKLDVRNGQIELEVKGAYRSSYSAFVVRCVAEMSVEDRRIATSKEDGDIVYFKGFFYAIDDSNNAVFYPCLLLE